MRTRLRLSCVSCWLAASALAQDVHVIAPAPGPGVDFTGLQHAIGAASSGDTLLVRSGTYPGFQIAAKSIAIVADRGADVRIASPVHVNALLAQQLVHMRGLRFESTPAPAFNATNSLGRLWIEECAFAAAAPSPACVSLSNVASVTWVRCTLIGAPAREALHLFANAALPQRTQLLDTVLEGGAGEDGADFANLNGGTALTALGPWTIYAQGGSLRGGAGGTTHGTLGCLQGTGGTGAYLSDGALLLELDGAPMGGAGSNGCGASVIDGAALVLGQASTAQSLAGDAHALSTTSPVREGQVLTLTAHGARRTRRTRIRGVVGQPGRGCVRARAVGAAADRRAVGSRGAGRARRVRRGFARARVAGPRCEGQVVWFTRSPPGSWELFRQPMPRGSPSEAAW